MELTTLGASVFGGNYSFYKAQKALELAAAEQDLASAEKRMNDLNRKIQNVAERKARKDGAGTRARSKRDQPKVLLNAMRNKAENSAGENSNQAARLREEAKQQSQAAREKIEVLESLRISVASCGIANSQRVLTAQG